MNKSQPRKYIKNLDICDCPKLWKGLFFYMFVNPLDTKSSGYLIINRFEIPPSDLDCVSLWKLIEWCSHPSGTSGRSQWVLITIDMASAESQTLVGCLLGAFSNDLQVNLGDWQFTYSCYSPEEFKAHLCQFPRKQSCYFLSLNILLSTSLAVTLCRWNLKKTLCFHNCVTYTSLRKHEASPEKFGKPWPSPYSDLKIMFYFITHT